MNADTWLAIQVKEKLRTQNPESRLVQRLPMSNSYDDTGLDA